MKLEIGVPSFKVCYMHQRDTPCDLKPENLLVPRIIKIADFGLAREIHSTTPLELSTRSVPCTWSNRSVLYVFLRLTCGQWVLNGEPLSHCPGVSEADEIYKICVIGSPTHESWDDGLKLARDILLPIPWACRCASFCTDPVCKRGCGNKPYHNIRSWDPCKRPTATEALQHPFQSCLYIPPSLRSRAVARTPPSAGTRGALDQLGSRDIPVLYLIQRSPIIFLPRNYNPLSSGVQRKLDMVNQDGIRNEKPMRSTKPKYRQPGRDSPTFMNKGRSAPGIQKQLEIGQFVC